MPTVVASLPVCCHFSSYINYYNKLTKWIVVGLPCDFFIWIVAKKKGCCCWSVDVATTTKEIESRVVVDGSVGNEVISNVAAVERIGCHGG
jgi:hypothetical protein